MNTTKNQKDQALITSQFIPTKTEGVRGLYFTPRIERIALDKEISLALESVDGPPEGPYESSVSPEFLKADPFNNLA